MVPYMATKPAPVIKHRNWRFLLREFIAAHPQMRSLPGTPLSALLVPAASVAWWLAKSAPTEILERDEIHILLPGASAVECADNGRWFSFVPWLLGKPQLKVNIMMVGDELVSGSKNGISSVHLSRAQLVRDWKTSFSAAVAGQPEPEIFNGTLADWHNGAGASRTIDACVMFSPGFTTHYETWLTEDDLLPLLRKQVPIGVFCYSQIDGLEDLYLLPLLGFDIAPQVLELNPWCLGDEMREVFGGFAQYSWTLQCTSIPAVLDLDSPAVQDFKDLQEYANEDFLAYGADQALQRMGIRWEVTGHDHGGKDAIIVLPHQHGILESTREIGSFDEGLFSLFEPPLAVSDEQLASRPDDSRLMERILWALRLHRDWIAPRLQEYTSEEDVLEDVFSGMPPGDLKDSMKAFLKGATGEDVDPSDFIDQMRASGGIHGPTHPNWYDLLNSLGWQLDDYEEDPERFEPAFWTPAARRGLVFPVACEGYAFFPDDKSDMLAIEAMGQLAEIYPDGALLVFKAMPYREVKGHKYHFGGMLLWKGKWHPFAFNEKITSLDDIIDQVESGFLFGQDRPEYSDDDCRITVPFNRMCYGLDPNEHIPMMGLTQGTWVTLMPGG